MKTFGNTKLFRPLVLFGARLSCSNRSSSPRSIALIISIIAALMPCSARGKKATIEGVVLDEQHRPVKGTLVYIRSTEVQESLGTIVVPVITKSTVGVIAATFPKDTYPKFISHKRIDKNGHFRARVPTMRGYLTTYELKAECCGDLLYKPLGKSEKIRLDVSEGQIVKKDFTLHPNQEYRPTPSANTEAH